MDTTSPSHPKFVRWAIVLGIVIVLNIFFVVVRSLALPEPQFNDFCPANPQVTAPDTASCATAGGTWVSTPTYDPSGYQTKPVPGAGYCDFYEKCQPPYQAAVAKYDMYAFSLLLVLGIISIIGGVIPLGSSIVSSGLSFGGVVTFIIASAMYWNEAGNWVRLAISAIALLALLYIGWKRFRD